jgi:signal transduction histidine kinase
MTRFQRALNIRTGVLQAIRAPWNYQTLAVVAAMVGATAVSLSVTQPSLTVAWTFEIALGVLSNISLLVGGLTLLLNFSRRLIASQSKVSIKFLIYVTTNAIWISPHYLITKIFSPDPTIDFPRAALRIFIALFLFQIISTVVANRLNKELIAKEELVQELVKQRTLIIESEEETRELVSKYLHNTLQSGLVVINHQLLEAMKDVPPTTRSRFQSIVDELELMRKVEIRDASRALSPNLDVLTFEALLTPLMDVYRTSIKFTVKADGVDYLSLKAMGLALYRIIEQVVLNAAVHGSAKIIEIQLSVTDPQSLSLVITNDGAPFKSKALSQGTGTAIIDTWVAIHQGTWTLTLNEMGLTVFQAKLDFEHIAQNLG